MKKMKAREMATFASGDLFGGGAQLVIAFFYLRFLTDVVKINPILAGTVILISKIWDAVSDPIMGSISDNTRTSYGRRRPYMLAGFFLIVIAFTALWFAPNFSSQGAKFTFVAVSYMFFSTVSTIVMVPYTAFSSEISQDIKMRGRVNGSRLFFSQLSSLIGAVLPMVIVGLFPEKTGYLMMGLLFGIFYAVPFLGIFLWCRERTPIPEEKSHLNIKHTLSPLRIRTYRSLIGIYLLAFFVMDVVSAVFAYYMTYFIGRGDLLEMVLGTMLLAQIASLVFVIMIAERIGKPKTFIIGAILFVFGSFALGFYNTDWHISAIFIIAAVVGIGLIACIVMPWVMFPDVTDVSELAFGERRSGAFAGLMTFMRKFSSAMGIWLVGFMLQFSGYILPGDAIIPVDSDARINSESRIEIDLASDGITDILIDVDDEQVMFITETQMDYVFDGGTLKMSNKGSSDLDIVIEKGLKISEAYNFGTDSTMKSIKSFNQPKSFLLGLRVIVFILPGILLLLAIFIAAKYPLSHANHLKLLRHYKEGLDREEVDALRTLLI